MSYEGLRVFSGDVRNHKKRQLKAPEIKEHARKDVDLNEKKEVCQDLDVPTLREVRRECAIMIIIPTSFINEPVNEIQLHIFNFHVI